LFFNRRVPSWIRVTYYYDSTGGFLYGIFYGLTIAFFPIIARKIGATSGQMAFLTAIPFVGALFTFYWAHISGKRKKMPWVIGVKILARCSLFLTFFAFKPEIFLVIILLYWIFEYAGTPAYTRIMKDIYPDEDRAKLMGYVRVELALAAIIATYAGGFLLDQISYRYVFPLGATVGIFSLHFFGKIRVKSDENSKFSNERFSLLKIRDIFQKDKSFLRYIYTFFIFGFGNLIAMPLYPIFLVDTLRISNADAGKLGALFSAFWLISYLLWGRYIDKKGPLAALHRIFILTSFVPLLYFLSSDIYLVAIATVFSGATSGGVELARLNYITRAAREEEIGSYWGIDYSLMGIRGITAPFVGIVLMYLIGIKYAFLVAFITIFASFLLMGRVRRSKLSWPSRA